MPVKMNEAAMGMATILNAWQKELKWAVVSACFAAKFTKDNWYLDYFWEVQYSPACSKLFQSHYERYKVKVQYLLSLFEYA